MALQLFDSDGEAVLHSLGAVERELLEYAAWLHDIGAFLSYSDHRKHSYYFIRNADLLGFDDNEVALIATIALYHKKMSPRKRDVEIAALDDQGQTAVKVLSMLLRIAESLDRSHGNIISRAYFRTSESDCVVLEIEAEGDCHLEQWAVEAHRKSGARTFGRKLMLNTVVPVPA